MLKPIKNRHPTSKDKGEATVRWQEGTITVKSNPIPTWKVTHKLENSNTKKFSHCCEGADPHVTPDPQPGELAKGLGILRQSDFEGQWDLTAGLPQHLHRTGGNRDGTIVSLLVKRNSRVLYH